MKGLKLFYPSPDLIIWIQGESDRFTDKVFFRKQLGDFFNIVEKDLPSSVIAISGTTYCDGSSNENILNIQKEIAKERGYIFLGETDKLVGSAYHHDDCHFNKRGALAVSELFSQALNNYYGGV
jgi:hypothetical protein